ncbi:MAG: PAS domain S-box protein, partial [Gemmatimonadaceae bacterium]|nr:PAS domain S-box protein [Gemmatimonadaceae bacterium]
MLPSRTTRRISLWLARLYRVRRRLPAAGSRSPQRSNPAVRIVRRIPRGGGQALLIGAACIVFLSQSGARNALSAAAFVAVAMVLLWLVRRVAAVRSDVALLATSEARFRSLVQNSSDVILIVDADSTIRYASPASRTVLGLSESQLEGTRLVDHVHDDDRPVANRFFLAVRDSPSSEPAVQDWRLLRSDGSQLWTENTGTNLLDEPTVGGIVVNARDVSERRTLQSRLAHQAFHDELTRLANRALFLNRVAHTVARAPRGAHPAAVLFLDLDEF